MRYFRISTHFVLVMLLISSFLGCAVHHTLETQAPLHRETGPFENPSVVSSEANSPEFSHSVSGSGYTNNNDTIYYTLMTASILILLYVWTH